MSSPGQPLSISQRLVGVAEEGYRRLFWLISTLGIPPGFIVQLEVRGRRSGKIRSTVLLTVSHESVRYLVSVVGDSSQWVRNLRAASGHAVIRHGRRKGVLLEEVPVSERAPILRAYLKWALGARAVLQLGPGSPIQEFQRIAPDHPVFRIVAV